MPRQREERNEAKKSYQRQCNRTTKEISVRYQRCTTWPIGKCNKTDQRPIQGRQENTTKSDRQENKTRQEQVMPDTTKERLARVETKLDVIENNHLAHIQQDIDKLDKRLWFVIAGVAMTVILGFVNALLA